MILNKKPLALSEIKQYVPDTEESKPMLDYLKNFCKLSKEKALAMAEEIRALGNVKINEENIVKIVDFLPQSQEELSKIFIEVTLSEEEANAILEIVKKH